jgi:hypothetical protein
MKSSRFAAVLPLLLVGLLALVAGGCQQTPVQQATTLRQSTQVETAKINAAVDSAEDDIVKADVQVQSVAADPTTPAPSVEKLNTAHTDLKAATEVLAPVHQSTTKIDTNSAKAEQVTVKVADDLKKEQNHWLGFKTRHALLTLGAILAGLGLVFGVVMFVLKTSGFGPVVSLFATIGSDLGKGLWSTVKKFGLAAYHVLTFGLHYLGNKVRELYTKIHLGKAGITITKMGDVPAK